MQSHFEALGLTYLEKKVTTTYSTQPIGPIDPARVAKRNPACFKQQTISYTKHQKKIVFIDWLLKYNHLLYSSEYNRILNLVEHFELYIWNGQEAVPIKFQDLFYMVDQIVPTERSIIETQLAAQGFNKDEVAYFDFARINKLLLTAFTTDQFAWDVHLLSCTRITELESALRTLNAEDVLGVSAHFDYPYHKLNNKNIQRIFNFFPHLNTLSIFLTPGMINKYPYKSEKKKNIFRNFKNFYSPIVDKITCLQIICDGKDSSIEIVFEYLKEFIQFLTSIKIIKTNSIYSFKQESKLETKAQIIIDRTIKFEQSLASTITHVRCTSNISPPPHQSSLYQNFYFKDHIEEFPDNVKSLTLNNIQKIILPPDTNTKNIRELCLANIDLNSPEIKKIAASISQLEALRCRSCKGDINTFIKYFPKETLKSLQFLSIRATSIKYETLEYISQHCNLINCYLLIDTIEGKGSQLNFSSLKTFHLFLYGGESESACDLLISSLPKKLNGLRIMIPKHNCEPLIPIFAKIEASQYEIAIIASLLSLKKLQEIHPTIQLTSSPQKSATRAILDGIITSRKKYYAKKLFQTKPGANWTVSDYRLCVTRYEVKNDEVSLINKNPIPITLKKHKDPELFFKRRSKNSLAYYHDVVMLKPGTPYFLPSITPNDEPLAFWTSKPVIEMNYKNNNQYGILLPPEIDSDTMIELKYVIDVKPQKNFSTSDELKCEIKHQDITKYFSKIQFESKGENRGKSAVIPILKVYAKEHPKDFISQLAKFCRSFTVGDKDIDETDPYLLLNQLIATSKGVCHHRTRVFLEIIKLYYSDLGNKIQFISDIVNDVHVYVELCYDNEVYKLDLGGDNAEIVIQENVISEIPTSTPEVKAATPPSRKQHQLNWEDQSEYAFLDQLLSRMQKCEENNRQALLIFASETQKLNFYGHSAAHAKFHKRLFCYTHDLDRVSDLQPYETKSGTIDYQDSRAYRFMDQADDQSIFVLNCTASPAENSCFDSERTLVDKPIKPGVNIFALLLASDAKNAGSDFFSRFSEEEGMLIQVPLGLFQKPAAPKEMMMETKEDTASKEHFFDLGGLMHTAEEIIGVHYFQNGELVAKKGSLIKTLEDISENQQNEILHKFIFINGPTKSDNFNIFIQQLKILGYIEFNGKHYNLPKKYDIETRIVAPTFSKERFSTFEKINDFYITLTKEAFELFFETYQVNKQGYIVKNPGLIDSVENNTHFLISDSITPLMFDRILRACKEKNKSFLFRFPKKSFPGCEFAIENNTLDINKNFSLLLSFDKPAISARQLKNKINADLILHLSPFSGDLINHWEMKFDEKKSDQCKHTFMLKKGVLLDALDKNKRVIIEGDIPNSFYVNIFNLYCQKPFLFHNGNIHFVRGMLFFVQKNLTEIKEAKEQKEFKALNLFSDLKDQDEYTVRLNQMSKILFAENSPFLFLHGPSGTGKSTAINHFKRHLENQNMDVQLFHGIEHIKSWATATNKHAEKKSVSILVIDEYDLEENGKYNFAEGLCDTPASILFEGEMLQPTIELKIIFMGNGLKYKNRISHDLPTNHPYAVMEWPEFSNSYIENKFLLPILEIACPQLKDSFAQLTAIFMKAYLDIKTSLVARLITQRNAQHMALLFAARFFHNKDTSFDALIEAQRAAYDIAQDFFKDKSHITVKEPITKPKLYLSLESEGFILTPFHHRIIDLHDDELMIRKLRIQFPELAQYGTRGILIEGPSGIGKSSVPIAYLRKLGFKNAAQDQESKKATVDHQRFTHIKSAPFHKIKAALIKEAEEGNLVLHDEINSMPLESLLNPLLSDKCSSKNAGFILIGTQNPPHFAKRRHQSNAYENRFRKLILEDYSHQQLLQIIKSKVKLSDKKADELVTKFIADRSSPIIIKPTIRNLLREAKRCTIESAAEDKPTADYRLGLGGSVASQGLFGSSTTMETKEDNTKRKAPDEIENSKPVKQARLN